MHMKIKLLNQVSLAFLFAGAALFLVLYVRVTRGIDFTDEMQYYGQIKGMIETGQLFSNDLFIQQIIYIFFYPAFYFYHLIFNYSGFIFFGRLLLAIVSLFVYLYAYFKLRKINYSKISSAITALTLTFAIPYHGIFAISYNTISQATWIVFLLKFIQWESRSIYSWAVLIIIAAFAHPASALIMTLLTILRMAVEHDFKKTIKLLAFLAIGCLVTVPVILSFATVQQYLDSLSFSSGYGVGTAFFRSEKDPLILMLIVFLFSFSFFYYQAAGILTRGALDIGLTSASIIIVNWGGVTGYEYKTVLLLAFLCIFFYIKLLNSKIEKERRHTINWLVLCLIAYIATLGITSSNGIGQATGALMVGLPFFVLQASTTNSNNAESSTSPLSFAPLLLGLLLFMTLWSRSPYREVEWWRASESITFVPAFQFIKTSNNRNNNLFQMQQNFGALTDSKRTLIVSELPVLYLLVNIHPATCMLYMHSLTSDKSEDALRKCMINKKPEIIIDFYNNYNFSNSESRIKIVMKDIYKLSIVECEPKDLLFKFDDIAYSKHLYYMRCFR
jgi:hypothetical protein